ncbi:MATE family efflux transporter [Asanoa sp. NPDC049518]|uniref:MATE family efflux transporter n=1 Tax=unclassified Asanoa TaxID=2685164 RepID=UPI003437FC67
MDTATTSRRIAGLAFPALVVLAAEPLYVLVDTAVVGHLGSVPLAAVAVGGTVLTMAAWLGTILAYGTTGRAARRFGAGDRAAAVQEGLQASWLAFSVGVVIAIGMQVAAGPLARALAGNPEIAGAAAQWLRVAAIGAPGLLLAAAGNGWMRGVQDTKRPLRFVLGANLLSAALCPILVYPVGLGLVGSAIANVVAQTVSGVCFAVALLREDISWRPHLRVIGEQLRMGRDLLIRGGAFQLSFLSATTVAARFGTATVAGHQIAMQLFFFTALVLDAVAIAAQSLIGAALGAGDAAGARALARRIGFIGVVCGAVFAVVIAAGSGVVPRLFSSDGAVLDQAGVAWPWFVAMQPVAGLVFALDGVLIGAGDVRYLRDLTVVAALGFFLPAIWTAYVLDWGLSGIWAGLTLFVVVRCVALLMRLRTGGWAVVGAVR